LRRNSLPKVALPWSIYRVQARDTIWKTSGKRCTVYSSSSTNSGRNDFLIRHPKRSVGFATCFRAQIGITPKAAARYSIHHAHQLLNASIITHSVRSLICGYSDKSHFVREFRLFSVFSHGLPKAHFADLLVPRQYRQFVSEVNFIQDITLQPCLLWLVVNHN